MKSALLATLLCAVGSYVPASAEAPPGTAAQRVLLQAPRHVSDLEEDDGARRERLIELANAIDAATPHPHERALLLTQGWHESRWASYVQLDLPRCAEGHGGRCDGGNAWSPWQLHGTDRSGDMHWAAARAIALLRYYARRCGGELTTEPGVRKAISGYALGGGCSWSGADERVQTWRSLVGRL